MIYLRHFDFIQSNTPKIPPPSKVGLLGVGGGGSGVAILSLNCKITERLVPTDPRFKNRKLSTTLQKRSRRSLERHFALVCTIQDEKNSPTLSFSTIQILSYSLNLL